MLQRWIGPLLVAVLTTGVATAQTVAVPGTLWRKGQRVPETGYFVNADARAVYFSGNASGSNARPYARNAIERIVFDEPEEWSEAMEAWTSGEWAEAEVLFERVATNFRNLDTIEGNYGSLARMRQLECLRKLQKYDALEKTRLLLKKEGLDERYHSLVDLYVGWGTLARIDRPNEPQQLYKAMQAFLERPQVPARQVAQACYLRGVANDRLDNISAALSDYHRAMTLDFGADQALTKTSIESALAVYARDKSIALDYVNLDRRRLQEAHGLGSLYQKVYGTLPEIAKRFGEPLPEPAEGEQVPEPTTEPVAGAATSG